MSPQAHTPSRSSFPVVLAIIALFFVFWFLTSKVYIDEPEVVATPTPVDRPSLAEHEGKAQTLLQNYSVIDAANGKVRLPIERAMELVIAENASSEDAISFE